MNTWANEDLSFTPAALSVLESSYSDSRYALSHVQLTCDSTYTAFISESLQLMFPQV